MRSIAAIAFVLVLACSTHVFAAEIVCLGGPSGAEVQDQCMSAYFVDGSGGRVMAEVPIPAWFV